MARRGVEIRMNRRGIAALLKSDGVREDLTRRAERVLREAESSAPVDTGAYKDGLKIEQATTDRAVVRVVGTAPHSHLVETQSGTLARALDAAGGN